MSIYLYVHSDGRRGEGLGTFEAIKEAIGKVEAYDIPKVRDIRYELLPVSHESDRGFNYYYSGPMEAEESGEVLGTMFKA